MDPRTAGALSVQGRIAMQLRCLLTVVALAGASVPAAACSPVLLSPRDAVLSPGPATRFTRIVLAEVVASRAPARLAELEQWRADVLEVAAERRRQEALEAERARIHATTPRDPRAPVPPPPESPLPDPILESPFELRIELDLFVLETIHGPHQDRLSVPAGGQCGNQPRPGQQVLVFIRPDGLAHVLQSARDGGAVTFDQQFLDDVRACARGECPPTSR